jgi:hypothetical protein
MNENFTTLVIVMMALTIIGRTVTTAQERESGGSAEKVKARQKSIPAQIISLDENVYVVWGSNDTANNNAEVFFRTSSDGGQTYTDKINLSNSSGANSTDFDVEATDDNVIVSWWETNQTSAEPVIIVSTDNGATFGPILKLATNGTIGAAR